jgi:hypothetical protein
VHQGVIPSSRRHFLLHRVVIRQTEHRPCLFTREQD